MLVLSYPAPMFATNCWVISAGVGQECIIIDPGMPDISSEVTMLVEEYKLKPVAALLTHGHLDHTFSIVPLADGYAIPTYIHSEDRRFVSNPSGIHGPDLMAQLGEMTFTEPKDLRELKNGEVINLWISSSPQSTLRVILVVQPCSPSMRRYSLAEMFSLLAPLGEQIYRQVVQRR